MQEHVNQPSQSFSSALETESSEGFSGGVMQASPGLNLAASSGFGSEARGPMQLQANAGAQGGYFDNIAQQIKAILDAAPGRNESLIPLLQSLNNDSDHILQVRTAYYNRYGSNLIRDVFFITRPDSVRYAPMAFVAYIKEVLALLNMTYEQALMHAHGEINKIHDERETLHNFGTLTEAQRGDIDSDGRTAQGREEVMGVRTNETDNEVIRGNTTGAFYNINSVPNWNDRNVVIGSMDGSEIPVTVLDKALFPNSDDFNYFYKVRFQNPGKFQQLVAPQLQALSAKEANGSITGPEKHALALIRQNEGWIVNAGVDMAIPWTTFLKQIWAFDAAYADRSLKDRVTILRQMAHDKALPFDKVIGSGGGDMYVDTRPDMGGLFQLLKDSGRIQLPSGEVVDIYHAIVGMDVLYRGVDDHQIRQYGYPIDVGQNYSAATWAGDIGAAATDAAMGFDDRWEAANTQGLTGLSLQRARLDHYYDSRAPKADLWGNIDAWGMGGMVESAPAPTRVTSLFTSYYGLPQDWAADEQAEKGRMAGNRKQALTLFLAHYGATSKATVAGEVVGTLREQIALFAESWDLMRRTVRAPFGDPEDMDLYVGAMAQRFANWLQRQAANYNVKLDKD